MTYTVTNICNMKYFYELIQDVIVLVSTYSVFFAILFVLRYTYIAQ